MPASFNKIMVANRGEIACRIVETAKARRVLGLSISAALNAPIAPIRDSTFGVFRM